MWVRITCMKFAVSSWKKLTLKTSFITTLRTTIPARTRTARTCFWPCAKTASRTQTNKNPSSKLSFLKFYRNKICLRTKISLKHWTITWTNSTSSESKTNHNKVFPAAAFWMSWSTVKENQLATVMPLSPQLSLNLSSWKILHTWKKYFIIHKRTFCGLTTGQSLCTGSSSLKLVILKISRSITFRLLKVSKVSGTGKPNQTWRVWCTMSTRFSRLMLSNWKSEHRQLMNWQLMNCMSKMVEQELMNENLAEMTWRKRKWLSLMTENCKKLSSKSHKKNLKSIKLRKEKDLRSPHKSKSSPVSKFLREILTKTTNPWLHNKKYKPKSTPSILKSPKAKTNNTFRSAICQNY